VDAFAVDLQLMRSVLLPEINLSLGRELMARVVSNDAEGHGSLSIAGMLLEAELPAELKEGQELRLQVRELTPDRVVLGLQTQDQQQPSPQAALVPMPGQPPPGTGRLEIQERHSSAGGDPKQATHTLALRYDAPTAGPVDMYFVLTPAALHLQLTVAAGDAFDAAHARSDSLDGSLKESAARSVTVSIKPRYDPLDLYA
jgi:hypothetical protein